MFLVFQARRRKSKQPSSLTLEQEDRARARFYANRLTEIKSIQQKEVIDMINVDSDGLINQGIYKRYQKLLLNAQMNKQQSRNQHTNRSKTKIRPFSTPFTHHHFAKTQQSKDTSRKPKRKESNKRGVTWGDLTTDGASKNAVNQSHAIDKSKYHSTMAKPQKPALNKDNIASARTSESSYHPFFRPPVKPGETITERVVTFQEVSSLMPRQTSHLRKKKKVE